MWISKERIRFLMCQPYGVSRHFAAPEPYGFASLALGWANSFRAYGAGTTRCYVTSVGRLGAFDCCLFGRPKLLPGCDSRRWFLIGNGNYLAPLVIGIASPDRHSAIVQRHGPLRAGYS